MPRTKSDSRDSFRFTNHKEIKGLKVDDGTLEQILDSAQNMTNFINSRWKIERQSEIGWELLLKGMITEEWKPVMEHLASDRHNRLSLKIIYHLRQHLGTHINKVMKQSFEEHFKFPRNQVADWLGMYRQVIKQVI
jgi:hypothetical protein